ncbi:MAG: hypothetical protein CMP20_04875 [Rickettsiales bacterium]|nr:hypothetical protein [Rickettsiales bacterium]
MGGAFSSSYRVVTGDPPETEAPLIPSDSEPIQTNPLPNGIVMYADGQRPKGFTGVNTFYCRHYADIPHMTVDGLDVPALSVICALIDRNDFNDFNKMQSLTRMDFSDPELIKSGVGERKQLNQNLNTHKALFNHTFTLVTHGAYCYQFQSVFGPIEIFYAPEIHTSNGFSQSNVFVVVELPRSQPNQTVRRPLLGRMWTVLMGADEASSSQNDSFLAPCVSVLWFDQDNNEQITRFSDCQLDIKVIGLP